MSKDMSKEQRKQKSNNKKEDEVILTQNDKKLKGPNKPSV